LGYLLSDIFWNFEGYFEENLLIAYVIVLVMSYSVCKDDWKRWKKKITTKYDVVRRPVNDCVAWFLMVLLRIAAI